MDENHDTTPELLHAITVNGVAYCTMKECGLGGSTEDVTILREVGKRGYYFLTSDRNIRRNPLEYSAGHQWGVGQFVFASNNMTGAELGRALGLAFRALRYLVENQPRPFIASIGKAGDVQLLYDCDGKIQGNSVRVVVRREGPKAKSAKAG